MLAAINNSLRLSSPMPANSVIIRFGRMRTANRHPEQSIDKQEQSKPRIIRDINDVDRKLLAERSGNVENAKIQSHSNTHTNTKASTKSNVKAKKIEEHHSGKNDTVNGLSDEEQAIVNQLKATDRKVKAHEQAHLAAASGLSASGPNYTYQKGPDNKSYAVAGEVHIDTSGVGGDPEATIAKMRRVQAAALAPSDPSPQDRSVAIAASQAIASAQSEITKTRSNSGNEKSDKSSAINDKYSEIEESGQLLDLIA